MAAPMNMVTLRDGSEVSEPIYKLAIDAITEAWKSNNIDRLLSIVELVEKCKDSKFQFSDRIYTDLLKKAGLINREGVIPEDIQKIALNCCKGQGLEMQLVDPLIPQRVTEIKQIV